MPKNYKTGTPHKKNRGCPLCSARTRNLDLHFKDNHNIEDRKAWYQECFEAFAAGFPRGERI